MNLDMPMDDEQVIHAALATIDVGKKLIELIGAQPDHAQADLDAVAAALAETLLSVFQWMPSRKADDTHLAITLTSWL